MSRLLLVVSVVAVLYAGLLGGVVDWVISSNERIIAVAAALEVVLMALLVYALSYPRYKGDE